MHNDMQKFERIARSAHQFSEGDSGPLARQHPFDERSIHIGFPNKVRKLFDDGHYAESTFEAFKFIDRTVANNAQIRDSGFKLMMAAFDEGKPVLKLTSMKEVSEVDEQKGFRFIFAGSFLAIRNPHAHEHSLQEGPDACLDYLAFASLLLRRLQVAGYVAPVA